MGNSFSARGLAVGAAFCFATGCWGDDLAPPPGDAAPPPALLDPHAIPKFVAPLVVPPEMPPEGTSGGVVHYQIAARQFEQQMLPPGMPPTTVWGYGRASDPTTLHTPSFTIEARRDQPMRITWINGLVDDEGRYLPHILPVDATLHWANPGGHGDPADTGAPATYTGPVPFVVHVHGAHVATAADGNPLAWYLPAASDIPEGYRRHGSLYASSEDVGAGAAVFEYQNRRRAETLWFHDHALGVTRLNVYAGLAGFFLIRDEEEDALGLPGPAPRLGEPPGTAHYELPIAIQDRSFYQDGSLAYPASRAEFDGYRGPYVPETPVHPVWNPEVFGNTMVVNGNTWPFVEVEPRLYRLRILNGTNARTLRLAFDRPVTFHLIGIEGGLLSSAPVEQGELLLGPAERADVLVDFSSHAVGDQLVLLNTGPDEPYQGPGADQSPADPDTTGQVMQFRIVPAKASGTPGVIPTALPAIEPMTTELPPRDLTLNERMYEAADVPVEAMLGTAERGPLEWTEEATEKPALGTTEIWRLLNLTADTHPIHLHLVMFQVLDRTPFDAAGYRAAQGSYLMGEGEAPDVEDYITGPPQPAHPWENGFKDTVLANPGELTRIVARFDIAGLYVWHCHILEHEDNEMMRPFEVVDVVER